MFAEKFDTVQSVNKHRGKVVSQIKCKQSYNKSLTKNRKQTHGLFGASSEMVDESCQNGEEDNHDLLQWDEVDAKELKIYRGKNFKNMSCLLMAY